MRKPIISKKTLSEFREYFVSWIVREIQTEFDAADIECCRDFTPSCSGARRSCVEQYYKSLDLGSWDDARKLLQVFENALLRVEETANSASEWEREYARKVGPKLRKCLERDGFILKDGQLVALGGVAGTLKLADAAERLDMHCLTIQIARMQKAVEDDPRLAIGTAKELVETTCKTILTERGKKIAPSIDIMEVFKLARSELRLAPEDIPDSAKAAETIKRVLSNLTTIVQCLAELRNLYGTGHGPPGRAKGLQPRHARLAAGAASTLAMFLFETHSERTA